MTLDRSLPVVVFTAALLLAGRAGAATDAPASPAPPDTIGRYHVTVTVQERVKTGGPKAAHTTMRDLRDASGTIINAHGFVVTAAHVARSTRNRVTVTAHDGSTYSARVLYVAPNLEIALLKTSEPWRFDIAPPVVNASPKAGDAVTGIGLPADLSVTARPGTVRVPRYEYAFRFGAFGFRTPIVLDMQVESGFSGGPVFDHQDRWLGMIVGFGLARNDDGEVVNTGQTFVLPARRVLGLVEGYR
ncbi:MAG: serine protease [Gammaproteobacteria bacterium]|nr:serine protease [Gammaproteobacteria bacterium]